ncbi:TPA: AlpA family phage regulatory protein [Escherichia coli]|jgi:prophage regulatory protein|uniref:AlpA family phage regulatory protein n=1 Tax=Kluyvera genomosp. 3 TaxID=2774055 RepID=A0A6G9RHS2_9ENTR|nr:MULTISPECIES: AlpA family phage regulatory protein [Enterobacterales]ECS5737100.1 AlpA family phage regulatory protein [Salmonella enterica subsp. enterica serovar Lika]EFN8571415.1 AlpA family phage regulatory protein [Escherichia coli O85:H32]EKR0129212.1 AlpA family phage regulatory protein [Salmonella enterica]ELE5231134.1 AlpA family phage regulatory protein [Salmonella enterica subsp. enterica serovar Colindale]MDK1221960.1 AlpA family phage regulatory protein [Cronobacter turicensis]
MTTYTQTVKILRMRAVAAKLGIARSTIYDWLNAKSPRHDPAFPKPYPLGKQSVGWLESELDEWVLQRRAA